MSKNSNKSSRITRNKRLSSTGRRVFGAAWLLAPLLCVLKVVVAHADSAPPPAAAFGTLPRTSFVELSPDGKLIAWCDQGPTPQHILVFDRAAGKLKGDFEIPAEVKLRSIVWAGDGTLLFTASITRDFGGHPPMKFEYFRTFSLDLASGASHVLLMRDEARFETVNSANLVSWQVSKPHTVIMSTIDYSSLAHPKEAKARVLGAPRGWVSTLFEVDTLTGKGNRIETGDQFTQEWVVNDDGSVAARSEYYPVTNLFSILAKHGPNWDEIYRREEEQAREPTLYGLTSDGKSVIAIAPGSDGRTRLMGLPLDGSAPRVLAEDPTRDVTGVVQDRFNGSPLGVVLSGIRPQVRWLDPTMERHVKSLEASFPGREVALYGRSLDGMQWIALVSGPSAAPVFYLIDYASHRADIIGEEYPDLANVKLGSVRAFTYRARDGTQIPAYLTTPPDAADKPLPLVVLPHGGPRARDDYGFDWWAQFLATRGYLVLQPQFRGSTGFGKAFADAGIRQWGGLMQDDVTDGVKALIDQHIADPHRICIVGASYGGYAALAGVAFTPGLYACAVSVNGVSDLPMMFGHEREAYGTNYNSTAYWFRDIGSVFDPKVAAVSPHRSAAQVTAPVLLLHSSDDTVVPFQQSQIMLSALNQAGKPATLVTLPGDDHWLSRTETRVRMLQEIETFLKAKL